MFQFFSENLGTIIVVAILAAVVALIIRKLIKDKRAGKSPGCGCGCEDCPSANACNNTNILN